MVCSSVNVLVGFGGSSIPAGAVSDLHVGSAKSSAAAFSAFSFLAFDVDLFVDFFGFFGVQIFSTSAGPRRKALSAVCRERLLRQHLLLLQTPQIGEQILELHLFLLRFSRRFSGVLVGAHFEHQLKLYIDSFLFH